MQQLTNTVATAHPRDGSKEISMHFSNRTYSDQRSGRSQRNMINFIKPLLDITH